MTREQDAQLHIALYNVPIEWRVCTTDPESGMWEDVQWHEDTPKVGDIVWTHAAELHPCYNWLDTDDPAKCGWSPESIADTDREDRWEVVPFYSTDIAAAWLVVERMTDEDSPINDKKYSFGLEYSSVVDWVADFTPRRNHPQAREYESFRVSALTAPHAICLAAMNHFI